MSHRLKTRAAAPQAVISGTRNEDRQSFVCGFPTYIPGSGRGRRVSCSCRSRGRRCWSWRSCRCGCWSRGGWNWRVSGSRSRGGCSVTTKPKLRGITVSHTAIGTPNRVICDLTLHEWTETILADNAILRTSTWSIGRGSGRWNRGIGRGSGRWNWRVSRSRSCSTIRVTLDSVRICTATVHAIWDRRL